MDHIARLCIMKKKPNNKKQMKEFRDSLLGFINIVLKKVHLLGYKDIAFVVPRNIAVARDHPVIAWTWSDHNVIKNIRARLATTWEARITVVHKEDWRDKSSFCRIKMKDFIISNRTKVQHSYLRNAPLFLLIFLFLTSH